MPPTIRWVWVLGLAAVLAGATIASGQNPFRLKPGAAGKLCLNCHPDFEAKLKSRFVHTPVKTQECTGCHSPHAAAHGKLLFAAKNAMCVTCHAAVIPPKAVSRHKIALEGNCVACHDPHGSDHKGNLLKAGNELCVGCHKAMGESATKSRFKHASVPGGCLACHNPHASAGAAHLLKRPTAGLCLTCHSPESPGFVRQHAGYPVAKADCASCHDPHGSNTAGMLYDTVHAPVAAKQCTQCHPAAGAPAPFQARRPGLELCRGCHAGMMNQTLGKSRVHWPLLDQTGCLNCHAPHAARAKKLLTAEPARLCAKCHPDTMTVLARLGEQEEREKAAAGTRVIRGALTHPPVQTGDCAACHNPHASDSVYLMRQSGVIEGCGICHDWLKHSSHPMGEKYADSRNKNRTIDCLSCHRSHGTGYRHLIPFPTVTDLCVQCHRQFRR